jgi:hypothetical protein
MRKTSKSQNRQIAVSSDPEGRNIFSIFPDNKLPNYVDEFIICGDILDSTLDSNSNHSYNIRNLIEVYYNKKITLILGNRDINKIKCMRLNKLRLLKLDDLECNKLVKSFNAGTINFDQYETMTNYLLTEYVTWDENIENWPLFWNKDGVGEPSNITKLEVRGNINNFYQRFIDIFSASMGAMSIINTIMLELELTVTDNNHKAFIIFCIFNSLLNNNNLSDNINYKTYLNSDKENAKGIQGLLVHVFLDERTKFCHYYNTDDTQYFFSHGGLTNVLLEDPNKLIKYYNDLSKLINNNDKVVFNDSTNNNNRLIEIYNIKNHSYKEKIEYINDILKSSIKKIMLNFNVYLNIMFLLTMSANLACTNNNYFKCPPELRMYPDSEELSPILSGLINMKNKTIRSPLMRTIQVIGHKPHGFAPTIYLVEENNYIINLDTTNSFVANYNKSDDNSKSYLIINNTETYIKGQIKFSKSFINDEKKYIHFNTSIHPKFEGYNDTRLFSTLSANDNIYNSYIELDKLNINNLPHDVLIILNNLKFINFHGIFKNNYIFTVNMTPEKGVWGNPPNFSKHFYIIEKQKLHDVIDKIYKSTLIETINLSTYNKDMKLSEDKLNKCESDKENIQKLFNTGEKEFNKISNHNKTLQQMIKKITKKYFDTSEGSREVRNYKRLQKRKQEAQKREQEVRQREEEARQREEEARQREEEARQREEEARQRNQELLARFNQKYPERDVEDIKRRLNNKGLKSFDYSKKYLKYKKKYLSFKEIIDTRNH